MFEFKKEEVLTTLKKNREQHLENYKKALKIYKEQAIKEVEGLLEKVKSNKITLDGYYHFNTSSPKKYLNEYDDMIEMLEASVGDIVKLDLKDYKCFMKDEWRWSSDYREATLSKLEALGL